MSVNDSSSSLDGSLRPQFSASNDTQQSSQCLASMLALQVASVTFLLPPTVWVLYLGFQRWSTRRSSAITMSHTDFFTYNMAAIDLIGVLGNMIYIYKSQTSLTHLQAATYYIRCCLWYGRMMFPTLTCWERYLAVVHPITYRRMKQRFGIRIRNVCVISVWLQGLLGSVVFMQCIRENFVKTMRNILILNAMQLSFFMTVMLFCSLSVLHVLIRPRPGEMGGDRMRIHRSKQRAFYTILVIMGVLFLKFGGSLVCTVLSSTIQFMFSCVISQAQEWLALPSSLVLPLLFLHQHVKLPGCKHRV